MNSPNDMNLPDDAVKQVVQDVCIQALKFYPHEGEDSGITVGGRQVAAYIHVAGAWHGTFTFHCPGELSARVAAAMFGTDPTQVSVRDELDAMGELANMVGGNLKSLLPGPSHLSLPTVIDGASYSARVPGARAVGRYSFDCDGRPLIVGVFARQDRAETAASRVWARPVLIVHCSVPSVW